MKLLPLYLLLLCLNTNAQSIDTSRYTILQFGAHTPFIFDENSVRSTLSASEVDSVEQLLEKSVAKYNARMEANKATKKIDLSQYKRQYVAIINTKGQKEVWINCFSGNYAQWKQEMRSYPQNLIFLALRSILPRRRLLSFILASNSQCPTFQYPFL